ncbi:MAG TPA: signal peptidase II [Candidatus Avipropionibacterium avicola]|uniref:Lipoprotein signal peptidase n=1 Tax=Candidatus Avipropionibacterium avicola TaxID=2840701 RepID=A0A9D1KLQ6_9ACTN|nr:signal peptidase II [Candidatus Avipropionibacterium avicola]
MQEARGTTLTTDSDGPQRTGIDRRLLWALVAVVGWVVDQVTKHLAVTRLEPGEPVSVLGPVLHLQLVFNDGAAFSLGGGGQLTGLFTAFSSIAGLVVIWFVFARLRHRGWAFVLGLLAAGIFGNLTDRLLRAPGFPVGHVIDFLQLPYWPIFNVADICVTSAAVGIIWLAVIKDIPPQGRRPEPEPAEPEPAEPEPAETDEEGR